MIRLVRVELTRLVTRRAVLVLVAAAFLVPLVIGVVLVLDTRPPSADDIAWAEEQAEQEAGRAWVQKEIERCIERPGRWGLAGTPEADLPATCENELTPTADQFLWENKLRLADERDEGSGIAVVVVVTVLMLLAGTTFSGHDWASGSVSNQLLFEPRRIRVWLAKAAAVVGLTGAVALVVVTGYWLALAAVARSRDQRLGGGVLMDCLQMGWRGAAVATVCALAGYALTMLFRSTVATLGVLLGLGLAGGLLVAALGIDPTLNPALNLGAVIFDGQLYWAEVPCPDGAGGCSVERTLSSTHGVVYLAILLVAAVAASLASFGRRDVN